MTVKANYPPEAREKKIEGSVRVLATVGKDGQVTAAEVAESSGDSGLDQAAVDAALQWRFKPAMQDGKPIESQVKIPFHFHIGAAVHTPSEHAPLSEQPPPPTPLPPAETPTTAQPKPPETSPPAPPLQRPAPLPVAPGTEGGVYESTVSGKKQAVSRGTSDYHVDVEKLSLVPRQNAADFLKLAPGVLLTNEGGEGHAEQIFLRGFDAREGQDIEITVDGVPVNESGNLHGNGYADTHFIIPELIDSLRVLEGPFDPRQGNYAVAGSVDYHLSSALIGRGLTAKFTVGSFGTYRMLLAYAPPSGSDGTFVAADIYQTNGFGQNRDGRKGTVMGQYEGRFGQSSTYRITATAYIASFHTAGVIREDDYQAGRIGFYGTYDPRQGEDASRYSVAGEIDTRAGMITFQNQIFGIARPLRLRENFTGFLLDIQQPWQSPHGERGDLLDLNMMEWTLGARGAGRLHFELFHQPQEIEIGYFARGDFVSGTQQRVEASTGAPYLTEYDLNSRLGDIGLYADLNLRFAKWLALRGGIRGDVFTFDVTDNCYVHKPPDHPALNDVDQSCISQEGGGMSSYREPVQHISTVSTAYMPRGSLILGPLWGLSASASAGQGVRSIDPNYITQDAKTPFASITAYEAGLGFQRRFRNSIDLAIRSAFFDTQVDKELIFSQSAGRNLLGSGTTRLGSVSSARLRGPFYDLAANVTYVKATFDDTHLLVPYVPDLVFRFDGALYGELPWKKLRPWNKPFRASLASGITYVGPRPLPYGARSDTIFTLDLNATLGWWLFDFSLSVTNLLDSRYRLGEYNYASDFHSQTQPTLVPERHFSVGAPRTIWFSIRVNYGGQK